MRKLFQTLILLAVAKASFAQSPEISKDADGEKVVKGFLTRTELASDTSFAWFAKNSKDYKPDASAITAIKGAKDSIYVLAFGGTWCHDTQFILPKFFMLADAAGLAADHVTLIGVDHNKKSQHNLSETFKVENVPTFIVLKNGQELGRVVEYGKKGMWDRELGEVITGNTKK
jgi:thiol-disulfide isomerase/thioredoxin